MAASGYDISASQSSASATGATKFGNSVITTGIGGSVGFSMTTILTVVAALAAVWFFFLRKKSA